MKLFTLYEDEGRLILGCGPHAGCIATIKAAHWRHARRKAIQMKEVDAYTYKPGFGWEKPKQ